MPSVTLDPSRYSRTTLPGVGEDPYDHNPVHVPGATPTEEGVSYGDGTAWGREEPIRPHIGKGLMQIAPDGSLEPTEQVREVMERFAA